MHIRTDESLTDLAALALTRSVTYVFSIRKCLGLFSDFTPVSLAWYRRRFVHLDISV